MKKNLKKFLPHLTLLVPLILFYFIFTRVSWDELSHSVRGAQPAFLVLSLLSTWVILFLESFQVWFFIPSEHFIPWKRVLKLTSVWQMMVNILPLWSGHALMVYLLGNREKVGKTTAVSVLTLDHISEGFSKLFVFTLVAVATPIPPWLRKGMLTLLAVILVSYGILLCLAWKFKDFQGETRSRGRITAKLEWVLSHWARQLHVLRSLSKTTVTLGLGIGMKIFEAIAVYWVQRAFGVDLPLIDSFLVVAVLSLATSVPLSPGRLGIIEGAAFLIYKYLGLSDTQAITLGIFVHLTHTLPFLLSGYLSLIILNKSEKLVLSESQTAS